MELSRKQSFLIVAGVASLIAIVFGIVVMLRRTTITSGDIRNDEGAGGEGVAEVGISAVSDPPFATTIDPVLDRMLTQSELADYGYPDGWSVRIRSAKDAVGSGYHVELDVVEKPVDSDSDGLSDEREKELKTDPYKIDTDGDGLDDFAEVQYFDLNPNKSDSDGDGVVDSDEIKK